MVDFCPECDSITTHLGGIIRCKSKHCKWEKSMNSQIKRDKFLNKQNKISNEINFQIVEVKSNIQCPECQVNIEAINQKSSRVGMLAFCNHCENGYLYQKHGENC
jgi:hypothetical protein